MALQVWLPLNGNLQNQGTSGNIQFGGTLATSVGKVTSNSLQNTSNNGGYISNAEINLGYHQSMFCWVYFNSFYATDNLTGILGQHRYLSNQGMGLTAKYVSSTSGYLSINTGNGTSRTFNTYCGNTLLTSGKWYHVGYTYDGTTVTLYVNGNVDGTFTITDMKIVSDYIVLFAWSLDGTSGATIYGDYKLNGRLNDVRLYNHCLSVKEVKNLAKGLMLHYTLSRSGANLLRNTATEKSWSSGDYYYSQDTITPSANSYYTMSFDAKSNKESTSNFITYLYNNNSGRQCDSVKGYIDGELVYTGTSIDGSCTMPTYTYYRHYVIVRHFNSNATALTKQNVFRIYNAGSSGLTMYVKNAKIEVGDKSTPWIPNSADTLYTTMGFNTNIEDDTSGYNNNGTRTNITTWNTDTARYLSSMTFASNSYVKTNAINFNGTTNNYTISWWGNFSSASSAMFWGFSDGNRLNLYMASNYFYWNTGDGSANPFYSSGTTQLSASPYADSKWHHFTIVGNGTSVILYIDGSQKATAKTYKNIIGTIIYINGWDTSTSYKFNGRMSDFRIYATALSADDVKELYNVGASIDKNGNMHCYELVESV